MSSVQSPEFSVQSLESNVQSLESNVQSLESNVQLRKSISWEWKKNITETIPKRLFEHAFYNWKETTKGTIVLIRNKLF